MNNEWNINFFQNSLLGIWRTYSREFSICWSNSETSLFGMVWNCVVFYSLCFFNSLHIFTFLTLELGEVSMKWCCTCTILCSTKNCWTSGSVCRSIIRVTLPLTHRLHIWPFMTHGITEMAQNLSNTVWWQFDVQEYIHGEQHPLGQKTPWVVFGLLLVLVMWESSIQKSLHQFPHTNLCWNVSWNKKNPKKTCLSPPAVTMTHTVYTSRNVFFSHSSSLHSRLLTHHAFA